MTVKEIVIKNPTGLHARPASEFTRCAAGFKSKITVNRPGEKPVNAKSIIMVLAQSFIMGTDRRHLCRRGGRAAGSGHACRTR